MNITIRDVDAVVAEVLAAKAKKAGMSRQQYLLLQLNRMATVDVYYEERNEYRTLVKNISSVIERNTEQLQKISEYLDELREDEKREA